MAQPSGNGATGQRPSLVDSAERALRNCLAPGRRRVGAGPSVGPLAQRLVRIPLTWSLAPERAALIVRDDARPFALLGRWAGGGALIGSEPARVAAAEEDPFALLDDQSAVHGETGDAAAPYGAVGGGWFGYLGYQLGRRLEPIGAGPRPVRALPAFAMAFYDHLLRLDADGRWWFEALWTEERGPALEERLATLERRAGAPIRSRPFRTEPWVADPGSAGHALAVAACRTRIHAGDLFQANICTRLSSRLDGAAIDLFATAVARLRPDRAAYLSGPWGQVASLSPELFLERRGRRVRSAPIKGTRPRPADGPGAAAEREALVRSAKDRAENVMIVDLVRNDLGRVCAPGSIEVRALAHPHAHTGVWHLVSEVTGELRAGVGDGELVRAAFPPGSVTGAPKVAAQAVIAELESTAREVYTGAIGFAGPVAGLELNVAIRTFEFDREQAWLGVGGGVVADSDPSAEAAECATKAQPLLEAVGARLAEPRARRAVPRIAAPRPLRLGPRAASRPDPSAGIFETLLIAGGRPVALGRHLARLAASARALYDSPLPAGLERELIAGAAPAGDARMRVVLRPGPGGVDARYELTPLGERIVPVQLCPVTVPGGLGAHKCIDRRWLDELAPRVDGEPLLCDLDGRVLESARASVFAVEGLSALVTPPLDGRILPGVTRARVLALARELGYELRVEQLDISRLARAREVFVTGALGGVEPAHLEPGGTGEEHRVTTALAEALRDAERIAMAPA
jgi:para-aminobenzoate synthetase/4-amino-4-deoxychorismate lyase